MDIGYRSEDMEISVSANPISHFSHHNQIVERAVTVNLSAYDKQG